MTFVPSLVSGSKNGQNTCSNLGCGNVVDIEDFTSEIDQLSEETVEAIRKKGQIIQCSGCGCDCIVCIKCAGKITAMCIFCLLPETAE